MLFQAQAHPAAKEWNTEIESELFRNLRQLVSECDFMAVQSNKKNWLVFVFLNVISSPSSLIGIDYKNIYNICKSKGGNIAKHKSTLHLR